MHFDMPGNASVDHEYAVLDDIYHSSSAHEMRVKADLHNIKIDDPNVIVFLIKSTTYHHAFWPHTAKRFTAFKDLLRNMKDFPKDPQFNDVKRVVESEIIDIMTDKWKISTPGGKQEVKNLKQVMRILEKLEMECK